MKKILKNIIKDTFRYAGLDIHTYTPPQPPYLYRLLDLYQVDTIFDIGANIGQSGKYFRNIGFQNKIVSFEPIKYLFEKLEAISMEDPLWFTENMALGNTPGNVNINVSGGHAGASSILEMTENVKVNAPTQGVVRSEKITLQTLDSMMRKYYPEGDRCFLKIDVQGYEKNVLEGGLNTLNRVVGLKIEMSLVNNYKDEVLFLDMLPYLYNQGFRLVALEKGWHNKDNMELYQVDGILFRTEVLANGQSQ